MDGALHDKKLKPLCVPSARWIKLSSTWTRFATEVYWEPSWSELRLSPKVQRLLWGQTLGCSLESLLEFPTASNVLQPYEPRYGGHCDLHTPLFYHFIRQWPKKCLATFKLTKMQQKSVFVLNWLGLCWCCLHGFSLLPLPFCWLSCCCTFHPGRFQPVIVALGQNFTTYGSSALSFKWSN